MMNTDDDSRVYATVLPFEHKKKNENNSNIIIKTPEHIHIYTFIRYVSRKSVVLTARVCIVVKISHIISIVCACVVYAYVYMQSVGPSVGRSVLVGRSVVRPAAVRRRSARPAQYYPSAISNKVALLYYIILYYVDVRTLYRRRCVAAGPGDLLPVSNIIRMWSQRRDIARTHTHPSRAQTRPAQPSKQMDQLIIYYRYRSMCSAHNIIPMLLHDCRITGCDARSRPWSTARFTAPFVIVTFAEVYKCVLAAAAMSIILYTSLIRCCSTLTYKYIYI